LPILPAFPLPCCLVMHKNGGIYLFPYPIDIGLNNVTCFRGAWMGQLVEHPILGFSSGHDLRVLGSSPTSGSVISMESA